MTCPRCGHANLPDSHFCAQCGSPLGKAPGESPTETTSTIAIQALETEHGDEEHGEDTAAVEALPAGSALLVVKRGPNAGSRFLLDKDVTTAGRHPESDIFLDDVTVSRRHAEFRRDGSRFVVRDVGSLNGTYLNRERIDETELSGGDEVQIGKFRLVFFAGGRGGE
ncbi:MAG TPA: FHA domain-containing protein [Frankiaceae bacterium]|nr:FHA domain-containing protein [Frankiaceae bacterium]